MVFETENGISVQQQGAPVLTEDSGTIASGSFQFSSPEGVPVAISYVADENGFQPSGDVLPTPPPIPSNILRSLEYNAAHASEE
ncbi:hypothetical protein NQ314_008539 [Rhamnusium bicolor]|uniref:Uncharacterized protein n=1 Tax=Rhamnusium bicolor TaxID=1586634 RepID=A0AAV8Y9Y5_9CUCU|nr:hypothetical protein NQ314_008539 [Rhamnusium bicolor]